MNLFNTDALPVENPSIEKKTNLVSTTFLVEPLKFGGGIYPYLYFSKPELDPTEFRIREFTNPFEARKFLFEYNEVKN